MRAWIAGLLVCLIITAAAAAKQLFIDADGNPIAYWQEGTALKLAKSLDQGRTFSQPQTVMLLSSEVSSFAVAGGPGRALSVTYATSREAFFSLSSDGGMSFRPPARISGEGIAQPTLVIDNANRYHLLFVTTDRQTLTSRLHHAVTDNPASFEVSFEAQSLFASQDRIVNHKINLSPWGPLISFEKKYLERKETYLSAALGGQRLFSQAKQIDTAKEPLAYLFANGQLGYFTWQGTSEATLLWQAIALSPPPRPNTLASNTTTSTPEVIFGAWLADPFIAKLEISADRNFSPEQTWGFDRLFNQPASRNVFPLPVELPEGNYFLRLAVFDGFSSSAFSEPLGFSLDRTPPLLSVSFPSGEAVSRRIKISGQTEPRARLSLNGYLITPEANGFFQAEFALTAGDNLINLAVTDEAGNASYYSQIIKYAAVRPELTLISPGPTDWFKSGSVLIVRAPVYDPQNDVADEQAAELSVNGGPVESALIFDRSAGFLEGFVTLPATLPDGRLELRIRLSDLAGNTGEVTSQLNIDNTAPNFLSTAIYSNSKRTINLPISETGSGLDAAGTIVKINGISLESWSTNEAAGLSLRANLPLSDGSYEAEITPRDRIGNLGKTAAFSLIVDTLPPRLELLASPEAETTNYKITIQALADDAALEEVKFFNNGKLIDRFRPARAEFSKELPVFSGNNEIMITAVDAAGNATSRSFKTRSLARAAGAILNSAGQGPNPFSPSSDGEMKFVYNLVAPANLKAYIFSLTGELIWQKTLSNASSGSLAWDGLNQYGRRVQNGVYPYLLQFSAGGVTEIQKGKIIIFQ